MTLMMAHRHITLVFLAEAAAPASKGELAALKAGLDATRRALSAAQAACTAGSWMFAC
eukprot:COSAG01_NODE_1006_length_12163_cov_237.845669_13_plen_58_part_00